MLQNVAVDHNLPSEHVCLCLHCDTAPTPHLVQQKGVVPIPDREVAPSVGSSRHRSDLEWVDVDVQRVGVGTVHVERVHLPHVQSGHRRPVPHRAQAVDVRVRHTGARAVPFDPASTPIETNRAGTVCGCSRQIRQVARPRRSERGQRRSGRGGALIDGERHDVSRRHTSAGIRRAPPPSTPGTHPSR